MEEIRFLFGRYVKFAPNAAKWTATPLLIDVRFTPKSGHWLTVSGYLLCARPSYARYAFIKVWRLVDNVFGGMGAEDIACAPIQTASSGVL
jgi:hypothetical protein